MTIEPGLQEWVALQKGPLTRDAVWNYAAYRIAAYLQHLAWADASRLTQIRQTRGIADQLYRAIGSVAANFAEGLSRSSPRDRCRLWEYALGSTRESVVWYRSGRPVLGSERVDGRIDLLQQEVRLLLKMLNSERARSPR